MRKSLSVKQRKQAGRKDLDAKAIDTGLPEIVRSSKQFCCNDYTSAVSNPVTE